MKRGGGSAQTWGVARGRTVFPEPRVIRIGKLNRFDVATLGAGVVEFCCGNVLRSIFGRRFHFVLKNVENIVLRESHQIFLRRYTLQLLAIGMV